MKSFKSDFNSNLSQSKFISTLRLFSTDSLYVSNALLIKTSLPKD